MVVASAHGPLPAGPSRERGSIPASTAEIRRDADRRGNRCHLAHHRTPQQRGQTGLGSVLGAGRDGQCDFRLDGREPGDDEAHPCPGAQRRLGGPERGWRRKVERQLERGVGEVPDIGDPVLGGQRGEFRRTRPPAAEVGQSNRDRTLGTARVAVPVVGDGEPEVGSVRTRRPAGPRRRGLRPFVSYTDGRSYRCFGAGAVHLGR